METTSKPRELHVILKDNHMRILTVKQLVDMPAHNLLRYYKKLRKVRDRMEIKDADIKWDIAAEEYQFIDAYADLIKASLDTKEHVDR